MDRQAAVVDVELAEAEEQVRQIVSVAEITEVRITVPGEYQKAGDLLTKIKGRAKDLDKLRRSLTRPLDDAKKRIMALFAAPQEKLASAERLVKRSMLDWNAEQERIRRKEEERLRKQAEEERLREIEEAEKDGDDEKLVSLMEAPVAAPKLVTQAPKAEGVSIRKVWKWRTVDETAIPREYLIVNEKALTSLATSAKGTVKVPGVEFYQEETVAAGAR